MEVNNMTEKGKIILNSLNTYPLTFTPDDSLFRNCYAHALGCTYEDRELYTPGCIFAAFDESNTIVFEKDFLYEYFLKPHLFIGLIERDCSCMGIQVNSGSFTDSIEENSSKIAVTYSRKDNDFHFLRQNADGTWSHKPGYGSIEHRITSRLIPYHGESEIAVLGNSYKVIDILKLHKV